MNNVTRHNLIIRHNHLNDINHRIKVMRHKYVAQSYTTYTYTLILEGHTYPYKRIRLEPSFRTSQEWGFLIYWLVKTVQLYHLDSTLCSGVSGYSFSSVTWLSWTIPYCVPLVGQTQWAKCMKYECMHMFLDLYHDFQNCGTSSLVFSDSEIPLTRHFLRVCTRPTLGLAKLRGMSASLGRPVVSTPLHFLFKLGSRFSHGALWSISGPSCLRPPKTFWIGAGITDNFPVQWSESVSEIPRGEPLCEGFVLESGSCRWKLPLELQARRSHWFFQFQSAHCVPLVAFNITFRFQCFKFESVVELKVPGASSYHIEEDHLVLSHT